MTSVSVTRDTGAARGYAIALTSALVLSTTAIFISYLTRTFALPPLVLAFWRDTFVVFTLATVLAVLRPELLRVRRRDLRYVAAYGLVLAAFNATWTLAVALTGAAVATVLVYSSATFTAVLAWAILRERLGGRKVLAIVFSLAGCVLVAGALDAASWQANSVGLGVGILSGLCYAGYSLMGRAASQRGLNPWTTLFYTFGFAGVYLLTLNLTVGSWIPGAAAQPGDLLWLGDALAGWGVLFLLAAGPTVLGFGLYNISLVYLPSSVANLIVTLEPAFTALIAYAVLGERLTPLQVAGSLLIMAGVVLLRLRGREVR